LERERGYIKITKERRNINVDKRKRADGQFAFITAKRRFFEIYLPDVHTRGPLN